MAEMLEIVLTLVVCIVCLVMSYMFYLNCKEAREALYAPTECLSEEDDPCETCIHKEDCEETNVPDSQHLHIDTLPNGIKKATRISNSIFRYVQEKGLNKDQLEDRR